mgnify:FL=1
MKKTVIIILILLTSCTNSTYNDIVEQDFSLTLKWNKSYEEDTISNAIIGLQWCLSYLGASLPITENGIKNQNPFIILKINKLGFNVDALEKLKRLNTVIKATEEYQITSAIDLGRYVSLLIGSSEHYYEITGVPFLLSDLSTSYELKNLGGYVNNSSVSYENRIIRFSEQDGFNQLFLCSEISPESEEILEYETLDLMQNGQVRFGIYNKDGFRISNSDPQHSNAGKPAKCIWCHESEIQPLFNIQDNYDGFIPYLDFKDLLIDFKVTHRNLQNSLVDGVDFQESLQHIQTELLYISFMEPSAMRLSIEWNININEIENLLDGIPTHNYDEFPFLGDLYFREEIDQYAPFSGLPVSSSVREKSNREVNYLN